MFCTGGIIASGLYYPRTREKWFIYLSKWTFFFVTLYFICATIVTAIHYKTQRRQQGSRASDQNERESSSMCEPRDNLVTSSVCDGAETLFAGDASEALRAPMRWYYEVLWVIYNIASVAAVLVTISFWSLIYSSVMGDISIITVIVHAFNSISMVIDTMLSSIPVRLLHVVYPLLYTVTCALFTVIYWACGGTNPSGASYIYPQTDYTGRPVILAVTGACMFFIGPPLCQSLIFGFYCLRVWIKTKCIK